MGWVFGVGFLEGVGFYGGFFVEVGGFGGGEGILFWEGRGGGVRIGLKGGRGGDGE